MRIKKTKEWVKENDPELIEIMRDDFETMEYWITNDEIRYLPDGNEPHPIKSDKVEDLEEGYIEMLMEG